MPPTGTGSKPNRHSATLFGSVAPLGQTGLHWPPLLGMVPNGQHWKPGCGEVPVGHAHCPFAAGGKPPGQLHAPLTTCCHGGQHWPVGVI